MKKFSRPQRMVFFPLMAIAFLFAVTGIVMLLWNGILPAVFGIHTITFWQSMGILVLCKLLFGFGFKGGRGGWGRHMYWKRKMGEQFANMTPEERDRFKDELRRRAAEWKANPGCRPPFFGPDRSFRPGQQPDESKGQEQQANQ